jgi:hypothetical protein
MLYETQFTFVLKGNLMSKCSICIFYKVLEYINTHTGGCQAYLIVVLVRIFAAVSILPFHFFPVEAKQHMFLTTRESVGRCYTKASHSKRNVTEEGVGWGGGE